MKEPTEAERIVDENSGASATEKSRRVPAASKPPSAVPPATAYDRMSPDPASNTDRYRLVTPFSLRI
ncbi:MAG: hypothetical protein EXS02_11925 [Planctomycetes bacterium]|nr:hypothetical protein [Planctomycetota bacterium]